MSKKAVVLIAIAAGSIYSLISGAPYLEVLLPGGLPIGNALAAIGSCSAAGAAIALSQPGSMLRRFSVACLIAALAWLPISIALAGNLALNFSGSRGLVWIGISLVIELAVLAALAWGLGSWIHRVARR